MSMNNQGRPSGSGEAFPASIATISGDRGLDHEEGLIFELGHGATGVDLPDVQISESRLGGARRSGAPAGSRPDRSLRDAVEADVEVAPVLQRGSGRDPFR